MWSPWWDPEVVRRRQGDLLREAERERLLGSFASPWRLRLARLFLKWARHLAPELSREPRGVSYGG